MDLRIKCESVSFITIWLTLRILCYKYSTYKRFSLLMFPLSRLRVPFPSILTVVLPPNVTLSSFSFFKVRNLVYSPLMWLEHLLLMCHWFPLFWAWSAICASIYFSFLLLFLFPQFFEFLYLFGKDIFLLVLSRRFYENCVICP